MAVLGFSSGVAGRESNVDRMVKAICEQSGREWEFVKLTDLTYSGCKGCVDKCAAPKVCLLEDDATPYYQKIKEADAVVLGTPVYFGAPNASMLAFVERFFGYRHVEVAIANKPFILAVAGCGMIGDAKEILRARVEPFQVHVLDMVEYTSQVFPCYVCKLHRICSIGGLYHTIGEEAHTLDITDQHFHQWEDEPQVVEAVGAAAAKLGAL